MPALMAFVAQRPGAAFLAFAALHVCVWTMLPSLIYSNLPLDLIEALTYGREWQLGSDKLPPLPWWLVEVAHRFVGADFAYYLLGEISVIAALAAVWATARALVGDMAALAAVLIVDGLHYLNYTAAKFNHDVIQLPFWALAGYAFRSGLRGGGTGAWLLLGIAIGGAFWAKYFVVVLIVPLGLFMLIDREARPTLKTAGPWLAAGTALLVMAPHLVWLAAHDFLPLSYASARATAPHAVIDHLLHPVEFAVSQAFFLVPSLLIAAPLLWPRPVAIAAPADALDRRLVTLLAFGPAATLIAGSLITGRGLVAMWGYPLWLFLGLWIVLTAGATIDRLQFRRVALTWATVFSTFALAFLTNYVVMPRFDHRYRATLFPGRELARTLSERYRAATGQAPAYVIATMWVGGNIAHYTPEQPRVLIDGNPQRAPWIDLADLKARGALVAWVEGDRSAVPAKLQPGAAGASVQPPVTVQSECGRSSVEVGWAILPPQP